MAPHGLWSDPCSSGSLPLPRGPASAVDLLILPQTESDGTRTIQLVKHQSEGEESGTH